ncbi:hypothetical protein SAY86_023455 [Trapa natans]|uniref:Uncharacterized protein n=1 Tax=Trapa natans TaxID=22666 RepID=A0AAN7LV08_TRANT|nr:hypothetical protein SAY86_023455 [Trapa natans]
MNRERRGDVGGMKGDYIRRCRMRGFLPRSRASTTGLIRYRKKGRMETKIFTEEEQVTGCCFVFCFCICFCPMVVDNMMMMTMARRHGSKLDNMYPCSPLYIKLFLLARRHGSSVRGKNSKTEEKRLLATISISIKTSVIYQGWGSAQIIDCILSLHSRKK